MTVSETGVEPATVVTPAGEVAQPSWSGWLGASVSVVATYVAAFLAAFSGSATLIVVLTCATALACGALTTRRPQPSATQWVVRFLARSVAYLAGAVAIEMTILGVVMLVIGW